VLQCVAVCCSVLQCVAVCCSVLQCVAVCCSVGSEDKDKGERRDGVERGMKRSGGRKTVSDSKNARAQESERVRAREREKESARARAQDKALDSCVAVCCSVLRCVAE